MRLSVASKATTGSAPASPSPRSSPRASPRPTSSSPLPAASLSLATNTAVLSTPVAKRSLLTVPTPALSPLDSLVAAAASAAASVRPAVPSRKTSPAATRKRKRAVSKTGAKAKTRTKTKTKTKAKAASKAKTKSAATAKSTATAKSLAEAKSARKRKRVSDKAADDAAAAGKTKKPRLYGLVKRVEGNRYRTPDGITFERSYQAYRHLSKLKKENPEILGSPQPALPANTVTVPLHTRYGGQDSPVVLLADFASVPDNCVRLLGASIATSPNADGRSLYAWIKAWKADAGVALNPDADAGSQSPRTLSRASTDVASESKPASDYDPDALLAPTTLALKHTPQSIRDAAAPLTGAPVLLASHLAVWRATRTSWRSRAANSIAAGELAFAARDSNHS
ncbi:uncharacterized protein AMSG_02711 [Thecamonas trahens ATCC 50062]|uniref:Uncharacterized protein n=1 Tax=Thecamonas trahens ATCC 50062 TaxID=461836 RepID=A0A0L0D1W0_THETB|nr:hypothetical protein AMSG_02711 [Thecamonas trahens ATCC 50062]KNC46257.1 hypothetical protein AMSG_02711 [Thecamonas trahens ATCC 50062]|eukprot:XP_013760551.1 hypothetical protein AMSG_02711 [Thecamonas trahens ATCC 50062]